MVVLCGKCEVQITVIGGLLCVRIKDLPNPVIISPGSLQCEKIAVRCRQKTSTNKNIPLVMIVKERARANEISARTAFWWTTCMIDTAGTLCKAAETLKKQRWR